MLTHVFRAALQWAGLLPLRVVLIVAGLFVVPIALPFRRVQGPPQPFSQAPGDWLLILLPAWAWLWSNDRDGAAGDKRGWWHLNAPFGLGAFHWFSMFWWLAIRNPANNPRFSPLFGCPVTECDYRYWGKAEVEDDTGAGGWPLTAAPGGAITASTGSGSGLRHVLWWCSSASSRSRATSPRITAGICRASGRGSPSR
ncbi:hypothetical protein SAMN05421553_1376 [Pseudomonas anguilliseptica]|uniref:Uncharacterized protein n=1 Tax=Pseudomonas anguilliseptica TaxID=53406 RepID=A0A1H4V2X1_PSEAG|nr:hypothetical protein [Pseudomonas anguilliseptica]SEC74774.1 hypothetical protein SAMN05421553_1376 [Pseudomonas anguilliseptica]